MEKKKKRKMQPHEKFFMQMLLWGLGIALFFAVLGWPHEITYEETDAVIRSVQSAGHSRHSRTHLRVTATDGRIFRVYDAQIPLVELRKLLTPGKRIHVEYSHSWITRLSPLPIWTVSELTLDGQLLLKHPHSGQSEARHLIWLGLPFPLLGFLNWASGEHLLKKWKKKREKERKKRKRHEGTL